MLSRYEFALLAMAAVGYVVWRDWQAAAAVAAQSGEDYTMLDSLSDTVDELTGAVTDMVNRGPVADMQPSAEVRQDIKSSESLKLTRYNLGDGVWTIGYGHAGSYLAIPETCTLDQAEAWFDDDIESRAAKWVRLYVRVPLTQYEFDALVHIAYNMSPRSFRKFADQVNAGQGIEAMAEASIGWVPANLQNGIRNRRNREVAMFNRGIYG